MPLRLPLVSLAAFLAALTLSAASDGVRAQEGWTIRSFDVRVEVFENGGVAVTEDIVVDFGALERHGIFRDLPLQYEYDADNDRLVPLSNFSVDDGTAPLLYQPSRDGSYLRLQIGDPDVLVTGLQRYRISYSAEGALNPFPAQDELYWNVTGDRWPVPIELARAAVELPGDGIERIDCFQGPPGSTEPCTSSERGRIANFNASRVLEPGSGLTFVVGIRKGLVAVAPPALVPAGQGTAGRVRDFIGNDTVGAVIALALAVAVVVGLARVWWLIGRDRWYGDTYYRTDNPQAAAKTKPLFAHQTVVVEYTPPEAPGDTRRLRPAEIGLLVDEKADTLDISATIVDLAVRKYLLIKQLPTEGLFGAFRSPDYELEKLERDDAELLPYERKLLSALFEDKSSVQLSGLKYTFHDDLRRVKSDLYAEAVRRNKFFPRGPEEVRLEYQIIGVGVAVAGGVLTWALGQFYSAGVIGFPIVLGGIGLFLLAPAMPRRSALGWETYRRCLGFRLYMVTAETDRQKFAEEAHIFHEYLPYAIVFGCVQKWAETFKDLDVARTAGYYVGSTPFVPVHFANDLRSFSTSISGVMASTPGGKGGSGFSMGGGFSGGGIGGGGGGSW